MFSAPISRREALARAGGYGRAMIAARLLPLYAWAGGSAAMAESAGDTRMDLAIRELPVSFYGRVGRAMAVNGTLPGPLVRLQEGHQAVLRVSNGLSESTSIHWHGILLPQNMDGVPGVNYAGIAPGETFEYRFPVKQSGTYWYHSHSGGQEQLGLYGPIIIDPLEPEAFKFDRDHVVVLSDWSFMRPDQLIGKIKAIDSYFNYQQRTLPDIVGEAAQMGWAKAIADRLMWDRMRMNPADLADVTGVAYTYLMNGRPSGQGWTGIFRPGERVRLRFIGAAAMTIFDVRIPGCKLKVVLLDGQPIKPVSVDEFRIAPGETYDVIVEPAGDGAYTIFAESLDRSGYVRGTLAPRMGMEAAVPERRKRVLRTMADMGMSHGAMAGMSDVAHGAMAMPMAPSSALSNPPYLKPVPHGPDHHGPGAAMVPMASQSRLHEAGHGLGDDGRRVLLYSELRSAVEWEDQRPPDREIELHLTGNMERFMWSIDGKKYSEAPGPIPFRHGERLRLTMVNDSMMEHPMHLHGMWMYLENGAQGDKPRKHTLTVKPAERVSVVITVDAPLGGWAFHCHLLLHMETGMFRVVEVVADAEGRT